MSLVYGSENVNTFSPSFRLDVDHLLQDLVECDRDDEMSQVTLGIHLSYDSMIQTNEFSNILDVSRCREMFGV